MTFQEVLETLRDGKAYRFTCKYVDGFFYKAPFPSDDKQTELDGAHSAITFWRRDGVDKRMKYVKASPTLMLYDFDGDDWSIEQANEHPALYVPS